MDCKPRLSIAEDHVLRDHLERRGPPLFRLGIEHVDDEAMAGRNERLDRVIQGVRNAVERFAVVFTWLSGSMNNGVGRCTFLRFSVPPSWRRMRSGQQVRQSAFQLLAEITSDVLNGLRYNTERHTDELPKLI
jgi:hypothetical protein